MPLKRRANRRFRLIAVRRLLQLLCLLPWAFVSHGQPAVSGQEQLSPAQATAMVGRALATELRTAHDPNRPMRYLLRKTSPRLTTTKDIVETRDGAVARLLSVNDTPLGPVDEQKEQARLDALAANPSLQRHRKQSEDSDLGIVLKLLRMLPNAFLYQYAGTVPGPSGIAEEFTFKPNPHFSPPDYETQALTAMSGEIWIDPAQERVLRLEGHLQQDTDYGWGILGRLNKGGWLVIEQADVGGRQWRITHVQMEMTLRILFKTKIFNTVEQLTRYSPVPTGIDYRQAIQMLRGGAGGATQGGR
jgi:hypothetical protein